MPVFTYKAKDRKGQFVNGTLEADSRQMVVGRLQAMGYFPVSIQGSGPATKAGTKARPGRPRRVRAKTLTMFYRQMSDLVGAGVPLVKSLGIVRNQSGDPALSELLGQVDRDVQAGDTFARALEKHPKVFTKLSTAMIHAGEMGGLLDEVLARLADFAEAEEEIKGKIVGALAYPAIMILAGIGAVGVLVTYVLPKIVGVFAELNQTLPLATRILIGVSTFLSERWYVILGALVLLVVAINRFRASPSGAMTIDRSLLRIPVLGAVLLKREIARFARTFGSLLRNGVPILEALAIAGEVLSNRAIIEEIKDIPEGIAKGRGIAGTLRSSRFFPPVVVNMILIGEETGNLPGVLLKVASTYETQVDREVKTLTSVLEPLVILFMGVVVGFIVIAMLLPIFGLDPTGGQ